MGLRERKKWGKRMESEERDVWRVKGKGEESERKRWGQKEENESKGSEGWGRVKRRNKDG